MNERDEEKARYQAYRSIAYARTQGMVIAAIDVHIDPNLAQVQMLEDGAFVEARIWVPREALPEGVR